MLASQENVTLWSRMNNEAFPLLFPQNSNRSARRIPLRVFAPRVSSTDHNGSPSNAAQPPNPSLLPAAVFTTQNIEMEPFMTSSIHIDDQDIPFGQPLSPGYPPRSFSTPEMRPIVVEKPKRPLSAYNMFFHDERLRLLAELPERPCGIKPKKSHGKIGFRQMATVIGARWRNIDGPRKAYYEDLARQEKLRHSKAMARYREYLAAAQESSRDERNTIEPITIGSNGAYNSSIGALAQRLDNDMIDFIVKALK